MVWLPDEIEPQWSGYLGRRDRALMVWIPGEERYNLNGLDTWGGEIER
jgi:hypothetical protein